MGGDGFGYLDGAVWEDGDFGVEIFDAEFFGLRRDDEEEERDQEVKKRTEVSDEIALGLKSKREFSLRSARWFLR
jgi:hypothetical protein